MIRMIISFQLILLQLISTALKLVSENVNNILGKYLAFQIMIFVHASRRASFLWLLSFGVCLLQIWNYITSLNASL
jgi:hypothetical protein